MRRRALRSVKTLSFDISLKTVLTKKKVASRAMNLMASAMANMPCAVGPSSEKRRSPSTAGENRVVIVP